MNTLKEAIETFEETGKLDLTGEVKQFKVRENSKKPGTPIFVRDDGKVGFPTINSISVKIGEVVKGRIVSEQPSYFLVEVSEVVE